MKPDTNGSITQCSIPTRSLTTGFRSALKWIVIIVSPWKYKLVYLVALGTSEGILTWFFSFTRYSKMVSNGASSSVTGNNMPGFNQVLPLRGTVLNFSNNSSVFLNSSRMLNGVQEQYSILDHEISNLPVQGWRTSDSYESPPGWSSIILQRQILQMLAGGYCGSSCIFVSNWLGYTQLGELTVGVSSKTPSSILS